MIKTISEFTSFSAPIIAAEIGVRAGAHVPVLMELLPIQKLYLVDHYLPYIDGTRMVDEIEQSGYLQDIQKRVSDDPEHLELILKSSEEASRDFANEFFDLVYIDACHDYEEVQKDIRNWWIKVKKGGYLCGHDYDYGWPGVVRAVDEFWRGGGFKIHANGDSDWLIKRT